MVTAAFALPRLTQARRAAMRGPRPNVLFIIMDDMRWDLMRCAGHPFIKTPNLDRLATEGARFTNAFVCLSLCSPSRASFLTGLYPHIHGVLGNRTPLDFSRLTTFPQRFQRAGYRTAMLGKWHMGVDADPKPGFDFWAVFKGQGVYFDPEINVDGRPKPFTGFTDDVTTGLTIEWMARKDNRPFAAILGLKSCHAPFEPPPRTATLYQEVVVPKPPTFDHAEPNQPAWIQHFDDTGHTPSSRLPFDDLVRRHLRLVSGADDNVGRLLGALEQRGELDRTLIIFVSDNGFLLHEHGLYDKRAMYEESIRIPLIVRYPPLIKRGRVVDDMVLNVDLAPTLLELIGAEGVGQMQGLSMLPALDGRHHASRSVFFYQYDREMPYSTPSLIGVRTRDWKLVKYQEPGQAHELYDLKHDPHETTNLHENPRHRRRRDRLEEELKRLQPLAKVTRPLR